MAFTERASRWWKGEQADLREEWRLLVRAALFFASCLVLVLVLAVVGIYH